MAAEMSWFGFRTFTTSRRHLLPAGFIMMSCLLLYSQLHFSEEPLLLQRVVRGGALHGSTPGPKLSQEHEILRSTVRTDSNNGTFQNASLINPHPYSFVMNNPDKCKNEDVFLLIVVTTAPASHEQREAIRQTWGNESNVQGVVIRRIFAVGMTSNTSVQEDLAKENEAYKDIIQENFLDSYRNLTLKTVMVWKWASQYCPGAKYLMKADDDAFVNVYKLVDLLRQLNANQSRRYVTGWVYVDSKPIRDPTRFPKWYVPEEEYPRETYPDYPCGFANVISNDITELLFQTSLTTKHLFLEDVYLGLCLEKLGIEPVHSNKFIPYRHIRPLPCYAQFNHIASHYAKTPETMIESWKILNMNCRKSLFGFWDILRDFW